MYQQFENRRSGRIAHVARVDEVCKTIILMYDEAREGDKENGITLSFPSVSKNWKRLDSYAHPDLSSSEVKAEDKAGDGTAYSEVMQEIIEDEKKAVKKAKDDKKDKSKKEKKSVPTQKKQADQEPDINPSIDFVYEVVKEYGDEIFVPKTNIKMRTFKTGGHMYCKFNYSSKAITVAVKQDCLGKNVKHPDKCVNHMFNALYKFEGVLNDSDKKLIRTLLECARNYRISKNNKNKKED